MEALLVMFSCFTYEEKTGLEIMLMGDNIPTSWAFITGSDDMVIRNAVLKSKEQLIMMTSKFPELEFKLGYLPSDKISADLISKWQPNPVTSMNSTMWRTGPEEYTQQQGHLIFATVKNGTFTSYPSVLSKIQKINTDSDGENSKQVSKPVVNLYEGSSAKLKSC